MKGSVLKKIMSASIKVKVFYDEDQNNFSPKVSKSCMWGIQLTHGGGTLTMSDSYSLLNKPAQRTRDQCSFTSLSASFTTSEIIERKFDDEVL